MLLAPLEAMVLRRVDDRRKVVLPLLELAIASTLLIQFYSKHLPVCDGIRVKMNDLGGRDAS